MTGWRECTPDVGGLPGEGWQLVAAELLEVPLTSRELRQRQSALARQLAGQLLEKLGSADCRVGRNPAGDPQWPNGYCGSIAHAGRFVAVVVASRAGTVIGIDLEDPSRLERDMWPNVFTAEERRRLEAVPDLSWQQTLAAVSFCAKEAAYKALFPHYGDVAGFLESTVTLDFAGADARLSVRAGARHTVMGRWLRMRDHVVVICSGEVG